MKATRREVVAGIATALVQTGFSARLQAAAAAATPKSLPLGPAKAYSFDALCDHANDLAGEPYVAEPIADKALLETINFQAYQGISFDPALTLWSRPGSPFGIQLFHLGRYFKQPVALHTVHDGMARAIRYTPAAFHYRDPALKARLPKTLGYAGFRLMNLDGKSDWLSFLGASYFRAAGPEDQYGMSARGLAIDIGLPTPEEFPRFSAFWLHKPAPGAKSMIIDALLQSESCTGAYRFVVTGPKTAVMTIDARLYMRRPIARLGIAPLTSMYWYSETNRRQAADWRPEVHDSDGLALWTGKGERIWRPLNDPTVVRISSFLDKNPRGFGLLQRDRIFADYEDDGAFYNKRPGVWVEPLQDWGKGEVQLLELPTDDEIQDNIGAYWVPKKPIEAGDKFHLNYRLYWVAEEPFPPSVGRVVATRTGRGGIPGKPPPPHTEKFVIDFEGGPLKALKQRFDVDVIVTASRGKVSNRYAVKVVGTDLWRGFFDLDVTGKAPVDLRCYLSLKGETLTETWLYQYLPQTSPA